MFGNLRKKLSHAIQEGLVIGENFQQQYGFGRITPATSPTSYVVGSPTLTRSASKLGESTSSLTSELSVGQPPANVNMAAGCALLADYENNWQEIRNTNEQNAQKAAQVANQIETIEKCAVAQQQCLSDLIVSLAGIPMLVANLREGIETLHALTALSAVVERELDQLEDLCEECELQEFMLQKQFELSQHKQKKMSELETYRQKVVGEHEAKIQQHEDKLRRLQRERQAVFDDAFRGDLAEYKQRGMLTTIPVHKDSPAHSVTLDEVLLDDTDTKDALEEFLSG